MYKEEIKSNAAVYFSHGVHKNYNPGNSLLSPTRPCWLSKLFKGVSLTSLPYSHKTFLPSNKERELSHKNSFEGCKLGKYLDPMMVHNWHTHFSKHWHTSSKEPSDMEYCNTRTDPLVHCACSDNNANLDQTHQIASGLYLCVKSDNVLS